MKTDNMVEVSGAELRDWIATEAVELRDSATRAEMIVEALDLLVLMGELFERVEGIGGTEQTDGLEVALSTWVTKQTSRGRDMGHVCDRSVFALVRVCARLTNEIISRR